MEREEFAVLVKAMKAVYSEPTFIPDQDAFNVWYELLNDISYELCSGAIKKYMSTEKFPPRISDIRKLSIDLISPEPMTELAAWSLVRKAISNSLYNAQEEFEKLPEECQRAIGNARSLKEYAMMDANTVESVIQSNFLRSYKVACKRIKENRQLPPAVQDIVYKLASGMSINYLGKDESKTSFDSFSFDNSEKEYIEKYDDYEDYDEC